MERFVRPSLKGTLDSWSCARVEDEDRSVDCLGRQASVEGFVDLHPVHAGVIQEPGGLTENLSKVRGVHCLNKLLGKAEAILEPLDVTIPLQTHAFAGIRRQIEVCLVLWVVRSRYPDLGTTGCVSAIRDLYHSDCQLGSQVETLAVPSMSIHSMPALFYPTASHMP